MFEIFSQNLVTLFLILLFSIKLLTKKSFRNTDNRYFWLTTVSCFLLIIEDILEAMAAEDPSLRFWRILLSVLGYTLRSTAALGLLLVILPQNKRHFGFWIPSLITLLTCSTAFFTDAAFGFDEEYAFYRGPLGYVAFIVPLFYIAMIVILSFKYYSEKSGIEKYIPSVCVLFIIGATVKGVIGGGVTLNEAIMISSVFLYIMLYSHDNRLDTLTGLLNRQAFYDDCAALNKSIGAVASLDMNGLKTLNDSQGHQAGDEALKKIGERLREITGSKVSAYRIGGDEFAVLYFHNDEESIIRLERQLKEKVAADGYSLSAGYAVREGGRDLDEVIGESDGRMYEDKELFYKTTGVDRRRGRTPETHE